MRNRLREIQQHLALAKQHLVEAEQAHRNGGTLADAWIQKAQEEIQVAEGLLAEELGDILFEQPEQPLTVLETAEVLSKPAEQETSREAEEQLEESLDPKPQEGQETEATEPKADE